MPSEEVMTVAVGGAFTVRLPATPTTGYVWNVSSLPEGIELLGSEHEKPTDIKPGDPGTQVFRFRAQKAGEHRVTLALQRQWEQSTIDSHTVTVLTG